MGRHQRRAAWRQEGPGRSLGWGALAVAALALAGTLAGAPAVAAQQGPAGPPPVDTSGLADGPGSSMEMLYQRTIFRVNVLHLTMRFAPGTASELERLVRGRSFNNALADSVARVAMAAPDVLVRSRFERNVSLDEFLSGLRDSLGRAREADILSEEERQDLVVFLEDLYRPLAGRGIRDGDTLWYRIQGDSLHVAVQALDGSILLEARPVGRTQKLSVLGGYLAPGTDFRNPLIRSLFDRSADAR